MKNKSNSSTDIVVECYDMLDVAVYGGITDFTDGKYNSDDSTGYLTAQANQANWLLDRIKCDRNSSILDIGCGYGGLLSVAKKRGAKAVGITLSPQQCKRCVRNGLDVLEMNYKSVPDDWNNSFDGIVANGSLEHYVQVQDKLDGKQDEIYRNFFQICHKMLKPGGYLATTAIHFNGEVDPEEVSKGSRAHPKNSDYAHFAKVLLENLGGWYPSGNQLERCASGLFTLESREDGTHDYNLTSEYWLGAIKKAIRGNLKVWAAIVGKFLKNPRAAYGMLDSWLFSQSWMWQFRERKQGTPTTLYRDVWKRID